MAELLSLTKPRTGAAYPASKALRDVSVSETRPDGAKKTAAAARSAENMEKTSYLERSTARRETALAGASGRAAHPAARNFAPSAPLNDLRSESLGRSGNRAEADSPGLTRSKQKPRKLYDQKAVSIAKTLSDRERLAEKSGEGRLSDNAKLMIAFILLIAMGVGLYLSVPEVTRVNKVSVNGMFNTTEKEITDALLLSPDINLVNADVPAMEARILANPKIASVKVRRAFPDQLIVNLVERKAVACVLVNEEIGTKSIAVDEEGVAFAYMDSIAAAARLPVLSGIRFERFVPGQRLPEFLRPLLGDIAEIAKGSPSPLEAFSEIKVEKISDSEAELLLFPTGRSVPIRMPARLTSKNLGSALLVLDILASRQGAEKIEEIDFRTGTIVYRTKEAQAD
ncbi:MAG TPA: FtsQ-type POTRA domain-containing protein [Rectinemataceae bacterium]|nr:FtsQ-type POTRA domain-containing protein [Rectinemataceae bacterium]